MKIGEVRRLLEFWFSPPVSFATTIYVWMERGGKWRIYVAVPGNDRFSAGRYEGTISRRWTSRPRIIKAVRKMEERAYAFRILRKDLPPEVHEPVAPELIEKRRNIVREMRVARGKAMATMWA